MAGGRVGIAGLALLAGITDDEYRRRAELHRPAPNAIRVEALRLLREGLQPRDVAQALRIGEAQVREWQRDLGRMSP